MSVPSVEITAVGPVVAGSRLTLDIAITVGDEGFDVEQVKLTIRGEQGWMIRGGKARIAYDVVHPDFEAVLSGPRTLHGVTSFRHSVELPADMPPNHSLEPAHARLVAKVQMVTQRWFDKAFEVALPVALPQRAPVPATPMRNRSDATAADQPAIEIALASTRLIPGGTIVGSCAIFHVDDNHARHVDVSLVPLLTLLGRSSRERRSKRIHYDVVVPAGAGGTSVPFELPIPADATPGFTTRSHELAWSVVVSFDSWLGIASAQIEIPVELVAGAPVTQTLVPPRVADRRIVEMLAGVVGWRVVNELSIIRDLGDNRLAIVYDYRGEDGTFVVSRIEFVSLGLELSVVPSSLLRSLFVRDVEVDISPWDRRHHVVVRSPAQAIPPLRAVVPTLLAISGLGELVRWTDDEIVFERAAIDVDAGDIAEAARDLERLVVALDAAHQLVPPPVSVDLEAWRELARWLDGTLVVGDLSIDGELDGRRVQLRAVFERGAPIGIRAEVGDPSIDVEAVELDDTIAGRKTGFASAMIREIDAGRVRALVENLRRLAGERIGPYR